MREPWPLATPQAMQQHGGVSKTATRTELPAEERKKAAACLPRDLDERPVKPV